MGRLFTLSTSLRGRLLIVGSLAGLSALGYMLYIFGLPFFEGRQRQQPIIQVVEDDLLLTPPSSSSLPGLVVTTNGTAGIVNDEDHRLSVSNPLPLPRVLLVSAFFQLSESKPIKDKWLQHFLGQVTNDIYIFTTPNLESQILQHRRSFSNNLKITVDTSYPTPFDIPPLKGKEDAYTMMKKKDRKKSKSHTPELFALRNSKPFFLHTALQKSQVNATSVNYDYVFWNDVANFHEDHQYREWPSPSRVREVWEEGARITGTGADELMFIPMWGLPHPTFVFWDENMGPIDNDFSQGKLCIHSNNFPLGYHITHPFGKETFFGGPPKAIDWYTRTFYAYHDKYLSLGVFVGKDQATANALLVLFPDRFITVWYNDPKAPAHLQLNRAATTTTTTTTVQQSFLGQCNSERFYYQFWLADEETKEKMRDVWIQKQNRWKLWGWWRRKDRVRCQSTRVLAMKDVLRRPFGDDWEPPQASIDVPSTPTWVL